MIILIQHFVIVLPFLCLLVINCLSVKALAGLRITATNGLLKVIWSGATWIALVTHADSLGELLMWIA
jgi:hypothetical protein